MKKTLLIGGTGFIGSALARRLLYSGHEVTSISRKSSVCFNDTRKYKSIQLDYQNINELEPLIAEHDQIVHLAFPVVPGVASQLSVSSLVSYLESTFRIFDAGNRYGKALVYISSGGTIYGDGPGIAQDESLKCVPNSMYGLSKLQCELFGGYLRESSGFNFKSVRPSNIYGPGQLPNRGQGIISQALYSAINGLPLRVFVPTDIVRDFIYIDDFIDGIMCILENMSNFNTYNVSSGIGVTIEEVLRIVENVSRKRGFELAVDKSTLVTNWIEYNVLSKNRLSNEFDWEPSVSLNDGIESSFEWMLKNSHLF